MGEFNVLDSKPKDLEANPSTMSYIADLEYWIWAFKCDLDRANARVVDHVADAQFARDTHMKDIEYMGNALMDKANELGWCNMYDDFIRDMNDNIHYPLPERERNYEVTFTARLRLGIYVDAPNRDAAIELAHGQFDVRDLTTDTPFGVITYEISDFDTEER